ncbi:PREDICTED: NIPA-like protein 2 [Elephantulus edwardii]|uniref:NIPA-like protein 2 n=1 Tax=Elephantulus edwardii TaxID=28737 RepID=UPI0003F0E3A2|nr:PREDICTED: NIPA-like protein 2 [Elephantulus edwardii]
MPRSRVRRALPSGAFGARLARSGSAYLGARGPAAEAGGKLPGPAGEHHGGCRCRPAVRVRAGTGVCAPVCVPSGPAGGVHRASPPVSGRGCRHHLQLQEAHRWLRGHEAHRALPPPCPRLPTCAPLKPQEGLEPALQTPVGAEPVRLGAGPVQELGAVVLNGQLRARPPPQTLVMLPACRCHCCHDFSALFWHVTETPLRPWLCAGTTPFPTPSCTPVTAVIPTTPGAQTEGCLRSDAERMLAIDKGPSLQSLGGRSEPGQAGRAGTCLRAGAGARWPGRAASPRRDAEQEVASALARERPPRARLLRGASRCGRLGWRPKPAPGERALMAALVPGDAASAALDELAWNFTYGAGAGNGSLSGEWYRRNQIHLFGVLLAILGNLIISISLNIQKYSHLQSAYQEHPRPFFKSVSWWGAVVLMALGETGNFAAYGFAPITLIAPLGCMSVTGSAIISVIFLKENLRASDLLGMTLAFAGTYLLVNFAPNITQAISARTVQYYIVGWKFLIYVILEILIFCILLYFHKRKGMKHIVILLTLAALLASLTVISVKAVSGMITFSVTDKMQLSYPIFYIMFIIMITSCVFQVKFLNQATKLYNMTMVVPINHVFFTISAIIAGIVFYQEFLGAAFLTTFIYLFGCFLSFLGVFLVTRNREKEHLPQSYVDFGNIPGTQMLDKIQPDSNGLSYGTLPDGSDSTKSQSGEKKEV